MTGKSEWEGGYYRDDKGEPVSWDRNRRDIRVGDKVHHRGDWCDVIAVQLGAVDDVTGDPADLLVESPYYPGMPDGIDINDVEGHQWKEHHD